jgi:hypothetical protein
VLISKRNTHQTKNFLKKRHEKLPLDFDYKQQICGCGKMAILQNSSSGYRLTANFPNLLFFGRN